MTRTSVLAMTLAAALATSTAWADQPAPQNVVGLSASSSIQVNNDVLSVTLSTTRDGAEAGVVQSQLKQALDAALAEAKKSAKPGQIELRTGNFSLFPRYSNKGVITGWQGTAELSIEGRDIPGIAQLTGRITTMTIARVGTSLSREQREKVEGEATAEAVARYKAKAAESARLFGFTGYTLREVQVSSNEPPMYAAAPMMRAKAMSDASESLPVELGKGTVTVTVNGTVQLTK
ncbi:SIMPL domain-containing protein [Piscinibacter sp. HJYY11]|uniref:SIMPL domain-containing protein n=1 Tax=Piscinibacter sp. HJYY11 TaxID=2801333 RepID=UPI00191EE636|nr:SIMPL domain-containing protein [Piscinibacter sp. HJYY11]MBL0731183.1 SIMPL domain-containing protein [Piscinibacter sp. HJYY11]